MTSVRITPTGRPGASALPWLVTGVILLGILFVAGAGLLVVNRWRFLGAGFHAEGRVSAVQTERIRDLDNRRTMNGTRVTVTFTGPDGRLVSVRSPVASSVTTLKPGDSIGVTYPVGRPQEAVIDRWVDRWLLPSILAFIGSVALLIGGLAVWISRRSGAHFRSVRVMTVDRGDRPGNLGSTGMIRGSALIVMALLSGAAVVLLGGCSNNENATGNATMISGSRPGWTDEEPQPTAAAPALPATPGPTVADTPSTLILQARAFLARPEQDRDMQAALRARAATHPALCPSVSFVPEQLVVGTSPPPIFDASGTMVKGALRQRFRAVGCTAKPLLSIFVVTAPGSPTRTTAGLMGNTIADVQLQQDVIPHAILAAQPLLRECGTIVPIDTRYTGFDPVTSGLPLAPWTEYWLLSGCGKFVQTTIHFTPDPANGRMGIVAPSAEARLIELPAR